MGIKGVKVPWRKSERNESEKRQKVLIGDFKNHQENSPFYSCVLSDLTFGGNEAGIDFLLMKNLRTFQYK